MSATSLYKISGWKAMTAEDLTLHGSHECNICARPYGGATSSPTTTTTTTEDDEEHCSCPGTLACGHIFGKACVLEWARSQLEQDESRPATCPMCRATITLVPDYAAIQAAVDCHVLIADAIAALQAEYMAAVPPVASWEGELPTLTILPLNYRLLLTAGRTAIRLIKLDQSSGGFRPQRDEDFWSLVTNFPASVDDICAYYARSSGQLTMEMSLLRDELMDDAARWVANENLGAYKEYEEWVKLVLGQLIIDVRNQ